MASLRKKPADRLTDAAQRFSMTRVFWSFAPADLEAGIQHWKTSNAMFKADPSYEILSVQGTYGPWKSALLASWSQEGRPHRNGKTLEERAADIIRIVHAACVKVSGTDLALWVRHCGRGVTYHSGFVPVLLRMRLIRSAAKGPLHFGVAGKRYALNDKGVHTTVQGLVRVADGLTNVLNLSPPRTCKQWLRMYKMFCSVCESTDVKGLALNSSSSYTLPWTFRSLVIPRMRSCGISSLTCPGVMKLTDFDTMFPDQGGWIQKLSAGKARTVHQLVTNLGYTGPLEFLTMFLCLSQDQVIRRLTTSSLPSDISIWQMIQDHKRRHRMTPNPAVLLECLLNDSPRV